MKRLLLVLLLPLCVGCGAGSDSLTGSISEIYSLAFDSVDMQLLDPYIVVDYLRSAPGASPGGKAIKLTVDKTGLTDVAGMDIDLTAVVGSGTRGTLQQIIGASIDLPIKNGHVHFDQTPADGVTVSGNFAVVTSDPDGRTVNGQFKATAKQL